VHLGVGRDALDAFVAEASSRVHLESPETVADLSDVAPELRERLAEIEAEQHAVVNDDELLPAFADRRYRKLEAERVELVAVVLFAAALVEGAACSRSWAGRACLGLFVPASLAAFPFGG